MESTAKARAGMPARKQRRARLGALAPRLRFGLTPLIGLGACYRLDLPFKRSIAAILISGAFLAAFSIPFFTAGTMIGDPDGGLFTAATNAFALFWLLGWSAGVGVLALVFLTLLLGRESLYVFDDRLILMLGMLGVGFGMEFSSRLIRNFRPGGPDESAGTRWRGDHLVFDYGGEAFQFGSAISPPRGRAILHELTGMFPEHDKPLPDIPRPSPGTTNAEPIMTAGEFEPKGVAGSPSERLSPTSLSSLALLSANLVPLGGVMFAGWRIGDVMLLFWAESAVIGFYNLLKMARISGWLVLFFGVFFVGHYGGFMAGHLLFIYSLFGEEIMSNGDVSIATVVDDLRNLSPALMGFMVSHGISFYTNFIRRGEYEHASLKRQMTDPYGRIMIMHVTIILGGFVTLLFNSALPALMLLIVLKIAADLRGHLKEHGVKAVNPVIP